MVDEARLKLIGQEAEGVKIDEAPEYESACVALVEWLDNLVIAGTASLELNEETVSKFRQIRCLARQGIDSSFDADYYSGRWMG